METFLNTQEEPIFKELVENLKALTPDEKRDISIFVQAYKLARTKEARNQ